MKKYSLVLLVVVVSLAIVAGCSKSYESQKNAGDMNVTLKADRYPLVKGDNMLFVKVDDTAGKAVTDATVNVRFYMPPMPGMAPMESTTQAALKGDGYSFTVNPAMEGGWKLEVTVARAGKPAITTMYNVDAR
jgi:hypothetical protein